MAQRCWLLLPLCCSAVMTEPTPGLFQGSMFAVFCCCCLFVLHPKKGQQDPQKDSVAGFALGPGRWARPFRPLFDWCDSSGRALGRGGLVHNLIWTTFHPTECHWVDTRAYISTNY